MKALEVLEDTSGGTLRGLQSQLAKQAMVVSTDLKADKKSKGERTALELVRILAKTLKNRGKKEKKDKKKEEESEGWRRFESFIERGGSGNSSETLIVSCSASDASGAREGAAGPVLSGGRPRWERSDILSDPLESQIRGSYGPTEEDASPVDLHGPPARREMYWMAIGWQLATWSCTPWKSPRQQGPPLY